MINLSVEHVLLFVILAFLLYHLIGGNCYRGGFSVGNESKEYYEPQYISDDFVAWYGCKGAFGFFNTDTCPPHQPKGNTSNRPPRNPNLDPSNLWKCQTTSFYKDDKCVPKV